jgi:hypothetical protein
VHCSDALTKALADTIVVKETDVRKICKRWGDSSSAGSRKELCFLFCDHWYPSGISIALHV